MPAARIVMMDSEAIGLPGTALHAQGFDVRGAADGDQLESMLGTFRPDLVILDVMLPGRDGFALLDVVRGAMRGAVLMLTARDALADRVRGLGKEPTTTSSNRSRWRSWWHGSTHCYDGFVPAAARSRSPTW